MCDFSYAVATMSFHKENCHIDIGIVLSPRSNNCKSVVETCANLLDYSDRVTFCKSLLSDTTSRICVDDGRR